MLRASARLRESTAKKAAAAASAGAGSPPHVPVVPFALHDSDDDDNGENQENQPPPTHNAALTLDEVNDTLTVSKLQAELRRLGLKTSGRKSELIARLRGFLRNGDDDGDDAENESMATNSEAASSPRSSVVAAPAPRSAARRTSLAAATPAPPPPHVSPPLLVAAPAAPAPAAAVPPPVAAPRPAADPRTLRVQYPGRPVETIKFDLADKLALEQVGLTLRSLFPDAKVNVDKDVDAEPIYLLDEYKELYIVTLEFLKLASLSPTDRQQPSTYQVRKGALPTALEDDKLSAVTRLLAIGCSLVQLAVVWGVLGLHPLTAAQALSRWIGVLYGEAHGTHQANWSFTASVTLCLAYLAAATVLSAFLSPSHRFGIKLWFPRLLAMQADARKHWRGVRHALAARVAELRGRLVFLDFAHHPLLPSRLGLPLVFNWAALLARRYVAVNLMIKLRAFVVLAMFGSLAVWQLGLPPWTLAVLFVVTAGSTTHGLVPGLAKRGWRATPLLAEPAEFACIARTASTLTIKWSAPANIPQIETTRGFLYSVGVSRYELEFKSSAHGSTTRRQYACAPRRTFLQRTPAVDELVFAVTAMFHMSHVGLVWAVALAVALACALLTVTEDDNQRAGMTVCLEDLPADCEFALTVTAYDELDRVGKKTLVISARTHPKTLFRRLLLASEEVPRRAADAMVAARSETQGHVRYSGVVWNAAMDDAEMAVFLRTLRSAFLPDPRKSANEADFVFSDAVQRNMHQVVSAAYLRQLVDNRPSASASDWRTDPLLIVHPAGTRHSFAKETIYSHLPLSPQHVSYVLGALAVVTTTMHAAHYHAQQQQEAAAAAAFWDQVLVDAANIAAYLWVLSNISVHVLKAATAATPTAGGGGGGGGNGLARRLRRDIDAVLDDVVGARAAPWTRDLVLWLACAAMWAAVFVSFGVLNFTSYAFSFAVWAVINTSLQVLVAPRSLVLALACGLVAHAVSSW